MLNIKFDRMTKYLLIHCFFASIIFNSIFVIQITTMSLKDSTELIAGKQYALKGYITDYQSM